MSQFYSSTRHSNIFLKRLLLVLAVILMGLQGLNAQTYYVFYNSDYGYIYRDGNNPRVSTTFTKNAIWAASGTLPTTGNSTGVTIASYTDNTKKMNGTTSGTFSLTNEGSSYWQNRTYLAHRTSYSYYVKYNNGAFSCATGNSGTRFTPASFTISNTSAANPTISITAASGLSGDGIQLTGNVTGTYTPAYSSAAVRRYNQNNTTTYYWTSTTEASTTQPSSITSWGDATRSWAVTTGNAYAEVSSDGLVTLKGNPTGDIIVTLTVTKGGYEGTQTFTLTRASVAQNVTEVTTVSTPTITPASVTLDYQGSQQFTASATATTTTTTIPAHTTLAGGGNTYYYYNGTLYATTDGFKTVAETHPTPTYTWTLTGAATSCLSPTSGSGSTITVTYGNSSGTTLTGTLTVTATAGGQNSTNTASITVSPANPTSITITTPSPYTVYMNNGSGTVHYTLNVRDFYDDVRGSSSNTSVFTVGTVSGGTATITPVDVGTATLTLEAYNTSNTFIGSAEATIKVKDKVATPEISFTQIGEGETATATISCATSGATIYYKVNSGSYSAYSPGLTVNENDVVYAYASMVGNDLWDDSDETHATYIPCKTPDPVITFTASGVPTTATVTITAETGATIYYTTNGDTPTTGSSHETTTVTINSVANETVVKAFAKNSTCSSSNIVTDTILFSGISSDGVVTLNDREDHSWSYYSDPDCPIHSLNPADVKITYNGNGTGTVQSNTNSDTPSTWGANATTVKVGIDANASTFIYYETLERTDGRTATSVAAATGRCAYTTIANPFSVRPTYDSDATSKYRGFYAWRVKSLSGGTIHSAASGGTSYAVGSTINAETEIYFAPSSEYGMEVEFEALWARAYVSTSAAPSNNLGVERNFYVITTSATSNITAGSYPCTYTSIYPNGTTNGTTAANSVTVYKYGGFTAAADSKIEYIILRNNSSTVNANGKNFTIGRGVSGYNGGLCATNLYGLNGNTTTSFKFNFASGSFTNLYFCGDGRTMSSGVLTSVIGCDYDRAIGDNDNLEITSDIIAGHNGTGGSNNNEGADFLRCTVKSGDFDLGDYGGGSQFYLSLWGNTGSGTYGKKTMVIEGGIFSDISGGIDVQDDQVSAADMVEIRVKGGTINGALYGAAQYAAAYGNRYIIVTGGEMKGWVAGGANGTQTTGGKLTGDTYVYFGGNARCDSEGSNTPMGSGDALGGNVFGAGSGNSGAASNATVGEVNNSTVVIADKCYVERGVYGGGNYGSVAAGTGHKSDIYILGGTVNGSVYGGSNNQKGQIVNIYMTDGQVNSGIYGGSNTTGTVAGPVTMNINGGQVGTSSVNANVHGGGYGNSTTVSGNVNMTIGSSTSATDWATVYGNVYGGSALGTVSGNATIIMNKGEINGNLFGGALGNNTYAALVNGNVAVTVNGGKVTGAVFGCNDANGTPKGTVTVTINGTDPSEGTGNSKVYALQGVYGGGNEAHYDPTTATNGYPKVIINGCSTSIGEVYGGGNAAAVPQTDVTIYGGDIGSVFAGGNGISNVPANVGYKNKLEPTTANSYGNGTATAKIYGGTIGQVFGGSNAHGVIWGDVSVEIDKSQSTANPKCDMIVGEVYGGGNMAESKAASVSIGCTGTLTAAHSTNPENIGSTLEGIGAVFGGANQADVTSGDIEVNINSGIVANVFGGNNQTGNISGTIEVNIEKTSESNDCGWYVGNVFGGGNLAQYTIPSGKSLAVNVLNGAVSGNVYGGGKGDANDHTKGQVTGNPVVTIGDNTSAHATYVASVAGDVYGGGDAGDVVGTPVVNVVNKCNTTISGDVYGGGNAADVNGTDVNIDGGIITGMVFGGGHGNNDPSDLKVADVKGNVDVDITGGTINKVFAGSNLNGTISGSVTLDINKSTATGACDMIIGEVYGGGNEAAGNAGTITVGCTGLLTTQASNPAQIGVTLEGIGAVYGGANKADIGTSSSNSNITLNINSGMVGNVYGGNNTSGDIHGTIQVNIHKTSDACGWYVGDVFGGGNLADYGGTPDVNIIAGTVSGSVFGGGNAADVAGSDVAVTGGQINGGVYGGCNSSGNTGPVVISLTGGQVGTSSTSADVFGGGFGQNTTTSSDITVTLNGTTVYGDLYGGSALGCVNSSATADTTLVNLKSATLHGSIFGGGKGQVGPNSTDSITATSNGKAIVNIDVYDQYLTGIYGGAYINGNVKGDITVNVNANVGQDATHTLNVFGGGFGQATETEGNVTVNFGTENGSIKPVIFGNLYGGSSQGQVNATGKNTTVYVYNGTVNGNVFGGGLGVKNATGNYDAGTYVVANDSIEAVVNGNALVYIGTAAQTSGNNVVITGNVFGGSDLCGNTLGDITVHIYHTAHNSTNAAPDQTIPVVATISDLTLDPDSTAFALQGVYGGGNLAHYKSTGPTSEKKASVYVHGCDNSIRYLYGGGNAANTTRNYIEIEGGRFFKIFGGGNGEKSTLPGANITNGDDTHIGATTIVNGGVFNYIFGGSNTKGNITGGMYLDIEPDGGCGRMIVGNLFGGGNVAPCDGGVLTVKCGDLVVGDVYGGANLAPVSGDVVLNIEGGNLNNVFGGSKGVAADPANNITGVAANIDGSVTLNLKGGTMTNAFGGSDQNGNITGKITVNVLEDSSCPLSVDYVYGGGNVTAYTPTNANSDSPEVNIKHLATGHSITHDVFGGGLGQTAVVIARPVVTIGDDVVTDTATIGGNVYGGGSLAAVTGNTTVRVKNAHTTIAGNVYGGGSQAGVSGTSTVQVANGKVGAGVYGGCNTSGTIGGNVAVSITGGTIGTDANHTANVHGGGYGQSTKTGANVEVTIDSVANVTAPVIWGDVYGGSALGSVNSSADNPVVNTSNHTYVTLNKGTVHGDIYGGGLGRKADQANSITAVEAKVWSPVQVTVNGGKVTGSVFGCNNAAGAPQSTVKVDIYGTDAASGSTYALGNVFGGGNQAGYTYGNGYPQVTVHNCDNKIGYVYGGGNAAAVASTDVKIYGGNTIGYVFGGGNGAGVAANFSMVTGDAVTHIYGGSIDHVFAGNNSSGVITGSATLTVDKQADTDPNGSNTACDMKIGEVYGGSNLAAGKAGNITIGCTGSLVPGHIAHPENIGTTLEGIGTVYGGSNAANVSNDILLQINDGIINKVFGGNNVKDTIKGNIQVDINKTGSCWYVGEVYGGGNHAPYGGTPAVNIMAGTVYQNVYGGGNDITADTIANTPRGVNGSNVTMTGGTVLGGIYGGCNEKGSVATNALVTIQGGTIGSETQLTNDTIAKVFGGGLGAATKVKGNVTVNFGQNGSTHTEFPKLYGDIYGGSALGDVNGGPGNTTTVNILNGELITHQTTVNNFPVYNGGNVFGGGLGRKAASGITAVEAKVYGTVTVNIGGPHSRELHPEDDSNVGRAIIQGNVYGCNNTNGSPQDSVTVNIYRTHRTTEQELYGSSYALHNVFGGGNEADYIPATTATNKKLKVYIHDCYNSIERVFGGSNAAAAGAVGNTVTVHTLIEGGHISNVFGGGNGEVSAANIKGDVQLEIHGGIVSEFFVGSNQNGTITGNSNVVVDEASNCESVLITEFFCGGKYADVKGNIEASINCSDALTVTNLYGGCKEADVTAGNGQPGNVHLSVYGGHYTNVFGGSKGKLGNTPADSANIAGNVILDLYGGTIENVFGGSNINGNIKGTITVNVIDAQNTTCPLYITNIYGGSNLTSYTPSSASITSPVVNVVHIKSGIRGNIYGASKGVVGTAATVTANPQVNIGYDADATQLSSLKTYLNSIHYDVPASPRAIVSGSVFGGGDAATVIGNTEIFLRKKAKVFGNVYGGGNMGEVTGDTKVIVNGQNN